MNLSLTKRQVRAAIGHDAAVARFFEISTAAVAQWDLDKPIPARRVLQAMVKRPDLFGTLAAEPAANDDDGLTGEEDGEGVTGAGDDVEAAQSAELKVHAASMEPACPGRYVRGDAS